MALRASCSSRRASWRSRSEPAAAWPGPVPELQPGHAGPPRPRPLPGAGPAGGPTPPANPALPRREARGQSRGNPAPPHPPVTPLFLAASLRTSGCSIHSSTHGRTSHRSPFLSSGPLVSGARRATSATPTLVGSRIRPRFPPPIFGQCTGSVTPQKGPVPPEPTRLTTCTYCVLSPLD